MNRKAKIITVILVVLSFLSGILMLYFGIGGTFELNETSKNYETTEGYLLEYRLYSKGEYDIGRKQHTSDTYILIYNYTVNGLEYTISTDYGTSFLPKTGSLTGIKYNPNNPEEAIVVRPNTNTFFIFSGVLFTGIPLLFLMFLLSSKGYLKKISIDVFGAMVGLFFIIIGYGAFYMITGNYSIKGIVAYFYSLFTFPMLIPIFLIVVGIYVLIKSLFFSRMAKTQKKSRKISG